MNWRKNRLLPYATVLTIILAALGCLGVLSICLVNNLNTKLYEHPFMVSNAAQRIRGNVLKIQEITLLALQQETMAEDYRQTIKELEQEVDADFQLIKRQFSGDPMLIAEAVEAFSFWGSFRDEVIVLSRQGNGRGASLTILAFGDKKVSYVLEKVDKISRFAFEEARDFRLLSERTGDLAVSVVMTGMVIALLLASFVFRRIMVIEQQLRNSNLLLEEKVANRTKELEDTNDELTASNEELIAMQEELRQVNSDLEERVAARTKEVDRINRNLEEELQERIRVESALREKEEWYRAVMEQSWDTIALIDCETKAILETNRRWREVMGYSEDEARSMTAYDLLEETSIVINERYAQLHRIGYALPEITQYRTKSGSMVDIERVGSVLKFSGREVLLFCSRVLTAERKLQHQIQQDILLAADVQRSLLPGAFNDARLEVETIYKPHGIVSGDFFDYGWSEDYLRFSGFVLDISGHGVASSLLGIVVSTFFRDVLNSPMTLISRLNWINRQVCTYFNEDSYGAALYFEFDFSKYTLTYSGAGIYKFLTSNSNLPRKVLVPGSLLGVSDKPEFSQWTVPFTAEDTFYFLTDGIYERVTGQEGVPLREFSRAVSFFHSLAIGNYQNDDCSGVCIRIKELDKFPLVMQYHRHGRNNRIRAAVQQLLIRIAGEDASKMNVAFGEALTNAARESMEVRVRINRFGDRLVIRVKDQGKGFDGNNRVHAILQDKTGEMFERILLAENGRGIMIMVSWMDRVIYNYYGNEVLMVKKLREG